MWGEGEETKDIFKEKWIFKQSLYTFQIHTCFKRGHSKSLTQSLVFFHLEINIVHTILFYTYPF